MPVIARVNRTSALWQQFGFLCDLITLDPDGTVRTTRSCPDYVAATPPGRILTVTWSTAPTTTGSTVRLSVGRIAQSDAEAAARAAYLPRSCGRTARRRSSRAPLDREPRERRTDETGTGTAAGLPRPWLAGPCLRHGAPLAGSSRTRRAAASPGHLRLLRRRRTTTRSRCGQRDGVSRPDRPGAAHAPRWPVTRAGSLPARPPRSPAPPHRADRVPPARPPRR